MLKKSFLIIASFAVIYLSLQAQQASNDANPLYRNPSIHIGGISVPPITGAPFSATALIEHEQTMPDGTTATTRNLNLIGRDSRGRTHGEMRPWVPTEFHSMPPLNEVHLFDPQTRLQTIYEPATHLARQQIRPEPRETHQPQSQLNPQVTVEDLGSTTLADIDVRGTRRTLTIPAQASGTGAVLTVVDEYWYSDDLHVNIVLRHSDPRIGVETITLSDIKREEPAPEFFQIPQGYKTVDMTPPAGAPRQ
jgi:hypothetical protein